jgi:hypothetical protein
MSYRRYYRDTGLLLHETAQNRQVDDKLVEWRHVKQVEESRPASHLAPWAMPPHYRSENN